MSALQQRFIRVRWSSVRKAMSGMRPGQQLIFPRSDYFNAYASSYRLSDADESRHWMARRTPGGVVVTCSEITIAEPRRGR